MFLRKKLLAAIFAGMLFSGVSIAATYSVTGTSSPGSATIAVGGTPQILLPQSLISNGYFVYNGDTTTKQGVPTLESCFIDPTGSTTGSIATMTYGGTAVELEPGSRFFMPGDGTQNVTVNCPTTGHLLTVFTY